MYRRKRQKRSIVLISSLLFIIYISFMIYVLFISPYYNRAPGRVGYNLVPFKTILHYIINFRYYTLENALTNLLGNIVVFIPLGFFLPIIFRLLRRASKTIMLVLILSLAAETTQRLLAVGSFDIDDIILNTMGGIIGYLVFKFIYRRIKS